MQTFSVEKRWQGEIIGCFWENLSIIATCKQLRNIWSNAYKSFANSWLAFRFAMCIRRTNVMRKETSGGKKKSYVLSCQSKLVYARIKHWKIRTLAFLYGFCVSFRMLLICKMYLRRSCRCILINFILTAKYVDSTFEPYFECCRCEWMNTKIKKKRTNLRVYNTIWKMFKRCDNAKA